MSKIFGTIISAIFISLCAFFYLNAETNCTYKINGNLLVYSTLSNEISISLGYPNLPLEKVKIKVQAKSCQFCRWKDWGETSTDESGFFSISKIEKANACSDGRYIRTKAKFKSDEMEIRDASLLLDEFGSGADWYTINNLIPQQCKGDQPCRLGNLIFKNNAGEKLSDQTAIKHAEIWYFYSWAKEQLKGLNLSFNKLTSDRIKVVFPLDRTLLPDGAEDSYVSPNTKIIHLTEQPFTIEAIWHELAHLWAFRYTTGEQVMRNYLFTHFNTHGTVKKPEVAFHEGFAEWFMESLKNRYRFEKNLRPEPPKTFVKKLFHDYLNIQSNSYEKCQHDLIRSNDKGRLECHEYGWLNILGFINFDDFYHQGDQTQLNYLNLLDIVSSPLCESENYVYCQSHFEIMVQHNNQLNCQEIPIKLNFSEILKTINGMDASELNLNGFLQKISRNHGVTAEDVIIFKNIVDPTTPENFNDYYCQNSLIISDYLYENGNWGRTGDQLKKFQGTSIQVKNIGIENTPFYSFLHTPIDHLNPDQINSNQTIRLYESGSDYLKPGSIKNYQQYLLFDEAPNGSLPATNLTWRTSAKKNIGTGRNTLLVPDPNWNTHTFTFTVGSDFLAESVVLAAEDNQSLIQETMNKSGGTFEVSNDEKNIYLSQTRIGSIDFSLTQSPNHPDTLYGQFVGACGVENIGNAPPFYGPQLKVYINQKLAQIETIPELDPEKGVLFIYHIFLDKKLPFSFNRDIKLRCIVDEANNIYDEGLVKEIDELNNESESIIFSKNNFIANYEIQITSSRIDQNRIDQLKNIETFDNPVDFLRIVKNQQEAETEKMISFIHATKFKDLTYLGKPFLTNIIRISNNLERSVSKSQDNLFNLFLLKNR